MCDTSTTAGVEKRIIFIEQGTQKNKTFLADFVILDFGLTNNLF